MQGKYKLIVGVCEGEGLLQHKELFEPLYFDTLIEVKEAYSQVKIQIKNSPKKIWFARVWEFGKEDYKDMGEEILDNNNS